MILGTGAAEGVLDGLAVAEAIGSADGASATVEAAGTVGVGVPATGVADPQAPTTSETATASVAVILGGLCVRSVVMAFFLRAVLDAPRDAGQRAPRLQDARQARRGSMSDGARSPFSRAGRR
jgi:hypothetical protein